MQNKSENYTCIFGGGAVRGMAYAGSIKALEELNINIRTIAGSSVGSIVAGLLAVGYTSDEIKNILMSVNFNLFKDLNFGFGKELAFSKGNIFLEKIREVIEKKFYKDNYDKHKNKKVTFKDLDKDLVIITTDLTNFQCKEFSKYTTPDFEVALAIRISSGFPGLMPPVEYEGLELVDGDLQKSCPLWELSENLNKPNTRILEFRLEGDFCENTKNPINYLNTVFSCITSIATRSITKEYGINDKFDYITINTGEVILVDFNMSETEREKLINIGYEQTINYFKHTLYEKKKIILNDYQIIYDLLNKFVMLMNKKNIDKAKNILGDIFINLYDCKDRIDANLCKELEIAKNRFLKELKPSKIFHIYYKKDVDNINSNFIELKNSIEEKINNLKEYISIT